MTGLRVTDSGGEALTPRIADLNRLLSRVDKFRNLPTDWCGDHTILISAETYDIAARLLRELPSELPLPQATPSAEGEVGFIWFRNSNGFEVVIQPDCHILWVMQANGECTPGDIIDFPAEGTFYKLNEALRRFLNGRE